MKASVALEPGQRIVLRVNGKETELDVPVRKTLLDVLREDLSLTGTHVGCEHGVCGCCNVLLDGQVVRSCILLAVQADGREVRTVEGLGTPEKLGAVQAAFAENHAMQCGYCTPGMIIAAESLLAENPDPSEEEIREAISGNLCRCTGYIEIVKSVQNAARVKREGAAAVRPAAKEPAGPQRYVGRRMPVIEDRRFAAGQGRYVNDVMLPNMLHIAMVRSPYAHARIKRIDVSAAEAVPGVVRVITGAMLAQEIAPLPQMADLDHVLWYPLAVGKARYAGEWVCAVVAQTRYIAEDAAELVEVDYEILPAVVDPEEAIKPGAPILHEEHGSNIAYQRVLNYGDVERIFGEAKHVVEEKYRWNRHSGVPLETFGAIGRWEAGRGEIEVWASHQTPNIDDHLSTVMGIPVNRIRVHQSLDVGGSHGVKRGSKQMALVAGVSRMLNAPVKFIEDRLENMTGGDAHGPDRCYTVRAAADDQGRIAALDIVCIDDAGAYAGRGALQIIKPITAIVGPYKIGAVRYKAVSALTCKTNQSPYRGFGQAPAGHVLERIVDRLAQKLGIDRSLIRERNFIQPGEFPYTIPTGAEYDSGDYPAVLKKALKLAHAEQWAQRRKEAEKRGKWLGVGLSAVIEPGVGTGMVFAVMGPKMHNVDTNMEGIRVHVDVSGDVTVTLGFQSCGQSHETTTTQLVCDFFGIAPERVRIARADSMEGIPTRATTGNRLHLMLTLALHRAAGRIREKMRQIAANALGIPLERVELRDAAFVDRESAEKKFTWDEVAFFAYRRDTFLSEGMEPGLMENAVAKHPRGFKPPTPDGRIAGGFATYSFSVHIPIVEIDQETLEIKIADYYVVHDCGTVINPMIVDGFVYGGVNLGIGAALYEQFKYDADGQPLSVSFMDYLLPSAMEVPNIELDEHCTPAPGHPLGAKAAGEAGYMPAIPAIVSAVEDAMQHRGLRITQTPITPDILFRMAAEAERGTAR